MRRGPGDRRCPIKKKMRATWPLKRGGASEIRILVVRSRYDHWRRGWYTKSNEAHREENEGYRAAETGHSLSENPHQPDTIQYKRWRRDWHIKNDEVQRAVRLGRT